MSESNWIERESELMSRTDRLRAWIIALTGAVAVCLIAVAIKHHELARLKNSATSVTIARLLAEKASLKIDLEDTAARLYELQADVAGGFPIRF